MSGSILIVEDEETLRESLRRVFTREGYYVEATATAEDGLKLLEENSFDVIIADIILPGIDGTEMLERVKNNNPEQVFILMTAYASVDTAVRALRAGAYDYIMKPIIHEEIKQVVRNALRQKDLLRHKRVLQREITRTYDLSHIIGESPAIKSILEEIRRVAPTNSTVLLLGETGTGKELLARAIHDCSLRRDAPFIPINCSAIPEHLLESELFGHLKGAFTGATTNKKGLLEEADGGTVFLDEIGDMSPALQAKILRVLEEQEVRPVGSTRSKRVDIRFVVATNRDLLDSVRRGEFREDLYYRVNVLSFYIPPLRERREDIKPLVEFYLKRYSQEFNKRVDKVSEEALSILISYSWPGNVRELKNVIERAVLLADSDTILPSHLPRNLTSTDSFFEQCLNEGLSIEEYTRAFILKYQHIYNEQELAERLGITRKTLWEKRKKWGIKRP